ncbi:MAG: hypothetical protein WC877_00640 [Dehalococcoidales bacterium]|jgi:hypothetical protein
MDIDRQAIVDKCIDLPNDLDGLEVILNNLATFAYKKEPINQDDLNVMFFLIGTASGKLWNIKEKENKQKL